MLKHHLAAEVFAVLNTVIMLHALQLDSIVYELVLWGLILCIVACFEYINNFDFLKWIDFSAISQLLQVQILQF